MGTLTACEVATGNERGERETEKQTVNAQPGSVSGPVFGGIAAVPA